jgi:ATP-dependent helicase/nuclease subunit A
MRGVAAEDLSHLRQSLRGLRGVMLESLQPLQIRTFHSWFAQLTRAAPIGVRHALGLPASYELLEDDAQAIREVWPRFWSSLLGRPELRKDYEDSVGTLGRSMMQKALAQVLHKRAEFHAAEKAGILDRSVAHFRDVFVELGDMDEPDRCFDQPGVQLALQQAARGLGQAHAKSYLEKAGALEQACSSGKWSLAVTILLNADGALPAKASIKGLDEAALEAVAHARQICWRVVQARRQHEVWLHQGRMVRLSGQLLAEFAALKRERGWVDMGDVEQVALRLLDDPAMGGWLQEVLDMRIRHLLVDEFQDTNPLQWQILHGWLQSYAAEPDLAPRVFLVGDPKQSIYRFRRADPRVFSAATRFVQDRLGGHWLACDHTWRNATAVTDLVNQTMRAAQEQGALQGFRTHTTASTEVGQVMALPLVESPLRPDAPPAEWVWRDSLLQPRHVPDEHVRQLEARQLAGWLAEQIRQGDAPQSFMVLSRKNERLARLEEELRFLGVPAARTDQDDLYASPEVQDAASMIEALIWPDHDLAFARVLKSPIFGLDDAALIEIAQTRQEKASADLPSFWAVVNARQIRSPDGRLLSDVWSRWQFWMGGLPVHDALSMIFDDGDIIARYAASVPMVMFPRIRLHFEALVGSSLSAQGGRFLSAPAFLRMLRSEKIKAPAFNHADAVQLLTIHKAKGLETDTVVLLDSHAGPGQTDSFDIFVDWDASQAAPRKFLFACHLGKPAPGLLDLAAVEEELRRKEDQHCLYVALTRAKRRLVVSASQGARELKQSWYRQIMDTQRVTELPAPEIGVVRPRPSVTQQTLVVLDVLSASGFSSRSEDTPSEAELLHVTSASDEFRRLGLAVHRLLEHAPAHHGNPSWRPESSLQDAVKNEFGLSGDLLVAANDHASRMYHANAWLWNTDLVEWGRNEVEVMAHGELLRLDRLLKLRQKDDQGRLVWWVVDYKLANNPIEIPALREQLGRYKKALIETVLPMPSESEAFVVRAGFVAGNGGFHELD